MKNLKIGMRLGLGFGTLIVLLLAVTFLGISRMQQIDDEVTTSAKDRYPKVLIAEQIMHDSNEIARSNRNLLLSTDSAFIAKELDIIAEQRKEVTKNVDSLDSMIRSEKGKELIKQVRDTRVPYGAAVDKYLELFRSGKKAEATDYLMKDVRPHQLAFLKSVEAMINFQSELFEKSAKDAEVTFVDGRNLMLALAAFAALLAAAIAWWVTRSITGPIGRAVAVAEALTQGDLTVKIEATSSDEAGQLLSALSNTVGQLKGIVVTIKQSTDNISTGTAEIASGNTDLSSRTEEQASSLEETASAMEELTSTVKQNAENARQANQLAAGASDVAVKGGNVVRQVVDTMSGISASSKKIADIIGVIDGIAFQTNILALNAAVEAARAGEQGRGFAVVASEVRNLAQRSAAAAKEIKELITDSTSKVDAGTQLVDQAGKTMDEIVTSVKRVTDIMAEITAASQEQSSGIEQVSTAVSQMDEVTQQNAALVEEAAAAAESLEEQAQKLAQAVSIFKLDGHVSHHVEPVQVESTKKVTHIAPRLAAKKPALKADNTAKAKKAAAGGTDEGWEEF